MAHAGDGLGELPHAVRSFGVAEVQAVGNAHRLRAHGDHVAGRFQHGALGPQFGVEMNVAPRSVGTGGQPLSGFLDTQHGGVGQPRPDKGVGADHVVVLLEHGVLAGQRR